MDFSSHNREVKEVWDAYNSGRPIRVPIYFNMNPRMTLLNPQLNSEGFTFKDYFESPEVMSKVQLRFKKWVRFNVLQDREMGYPENDWGGCWVDFQNSYEALYFGCRLFYWEDSLPDIEPLLKDNKEYLKDINPEPEDNSFLKKVLDYYEYFLNFSDELFEGIPMGRPQTPLLGTDGPFTVAAQIRGASQLCIDVYEDPDFVHRLLSFITDTTIKRITYVMDRFEIRYPNQSWGFADDSIELISEKVYREFVLPYHKKLINAFSLGGPNMIHLCGKASHHFLTIKDELNVMDFDTGYPTDLGKMRKVLGPEVTLRGNISPILLKDGPIEDIKEEVMRVLRSGVMEGGKFLLCEGNNVAPLTPIEHMKTMYDTGKEYGRYI
jgi:uroporphyrinogen-III decarboxylase